MDSDDLERRRFPRVQLLRSYHDTLHLRDVSLGGFSVESPHSFPVGEKHRVVFTLANGDDVGVRAVVTHCGPAPSFRPDRRRYTIGFAFGNPRDAEKQIKVVITAGLSEPISVALEE